MDPLPMDPLLEAGKSEDVDTIKRLVENDNFDTSVTYKFTMPHEKLDKHGKKRNPVEDLIDDDNKQKNDNRNKNMGTRIVKPASANWSARRWHDCGRTFSCAHPPLFGRGCLAGP